MISKRKKWHSKPPVHIPEGDSETAEELHARTPGASGQDPYLENLGVPDVPMGVNNEPLDTAPYERGTGKG